MNTQSPFKHRASQSNADALLEFEIVERVPARNELDTSALNISLLAADYSLQLVHNCAIFLISALPIPQRTALNARDLKGIRSLRPEGNRRRRSRGEELLTVSLHFPHLKKKIDQVFQIDSCSWTHTEEAALSSAIRDAWTTSWWIPTPHTFWLPPATTQPMYVAALASLLEPIVCSL